MNYNSEIILLQKRCFGHISDGARCMSKYKSFFYPIMKQHLSNESRWLLSNEKACWKRKNAKVLICKYRETTEKHIKKHTQKVKPHRLKREKPLQRLCSLSIFLS